QSAGRPCPVRARLRGWLSRSLRGCGSQGRPTRCPDDAAGARAATQPVRLRRFLFVCASCTPVATLMRRTRVRNFAKLMGLDGGQTLPLLHLSDGSTMILNGLWSTDRLEASQL